MCWLSSVGSKPRLEGFGGEASNLSDSLEADPCTVEGKQRRGDVASHWRYRATTGRPRRVAVSKGGGPL